MGNKDNQVPMYIFNENDDLSTYSTKRLIIKLFISHPARTYRNQESVAKALVSLWGISRSQGAISKCFKNLLGHSFRVNDSQYIITKYEGSYLLQNEASHSENLRYQMTKQELFERQFVYYEHGVKDPQTFVFWIADNEKKRKAAKKQFEQLLTNRYIDIFFIESKLVIMLDPESSDCPLLSDVLRNFFSPYYDAYKQIKKNK